MNYEALSSDTEFWTASGHTYVGPGVFWNDAEKRVYVRLQTPSEEAVFQKFDVPTSYEPRQNILHIGLQQYGLLFVDGADYIEIDGLDVFVFHIPVRVFNGSHITFRNMELMVGQYGLVLNDETGEGYLVDSLTFHMHLPDWIAWCDMKNRPWPARNCRMTSISIESKKISEVEIRNSRFLDTHDAICGGVNNIYIHHNYFETEDDAIQISTAAHNIEFAYNTVIGPGPSHSGDDEPDPFPGTTYYHHNIVDATKLVLWGRKDPDSLLSSQYRDNPLKRHNVIGYHGGPSQSEGDPWKIYNNTLISGERMGFRIR